VDAGMDATPPVASTPHTLPDQRVSGPMDAADAMDAEMRPLSHDVRPKTPCARCSRPQWNAEGSPLCGACRDAA
jgi:hypothetical protein